MTQNNNFSVLPFYDTVLKQNHRRSFAYNAIYPLVVPKDRFIPFQIINPVGNNPSSYGVELMRLDGSRQADLSTIFNSNGLVTSVDTVKPTTGTDAAGINLVVYPATQFINLDVPKGQYYLRVKPRPTGTWTMYSEVFTLVDRTDGMIKLEWWDEVDAIFDSGRIVYSEPLYRNRIYLDTQIGKPEYKFSEEGEERDGYYFAEKQISEKTYKFNFLAPEYLLDVMRLIRLSDYVRITNAFGFVFKADTFLLTPKWEVQGDLASVSCEFENNTVVKKLGLGVLAMPVLGDGGFNQDFNQDFNI